MAEVKSIRSLAKRLGVSHEAASRYCKRPDWPTRRSPPWNDEQVQQIQAWTGTLQADRSGVGTHPAMRPGAVSPDSAARFDPVIGAQVEVLLKKERMLHERLKREILEGKYVPRELVDGALGGLASLVIQILDELEMSLPPRLAGKTSGQIEADLVGVLDAARQRLSDKAEIELVRVADVNSATHHRGRGRPAAGIQL